MATYTKQTGGLKIIQANLLHCKLANSTICNRFRKRNLDFALIQEPYVNKKRFINWNKLKGTMFTDISAPKVRTCIFVSNKANYSAIAIPQFCNQDLTVVRVDYKSNDKPETVILASAYLPYEVNNPPSQSFQDLVTFCKNDKLELIVGCDSNAHHTIWGSTDVNPRGKQLSEYLSSTNLHILNKGNVPTFVNRIRREVLDITLASHVVARQTKNWRVDPEITYSDHKWITFEIQSDIEPPTKFRNPRKTNWVQYREILRGSISNEPKRILTKKDIDETCVSMNAAILKAYELSCPLSSPSPPGKSPGWTKELSELKQKSRKTFNKAYNSKRLPKEEQDELWDLHHMAKSEYKKACSYKDRKLWRNFTEEVEICRPMSKLKIALAKDPFQLELICDANGKATSTCEEALDVLLNKHFPGINIKPTGKAKSKTFKHKPKQKDWDNARKFINAERVKWAIRTFKPFKSPGTDEALIIESEDILIQKLVNLLQASLALAYIPEAWQEVKVIFIPKPGKSTYCEADAYRPISLTSILLKIMERILDRYIRDVPLKAKPLHCRAYFVEFLSEFCEFCEFWRIL